MFCLLMLVGTCVAQNMNKVQKELDKVRKDHQHKDCL